jgi:hypothetical protein
MYKKSVFSWLKHWDFMLLDAIVMQLSLMTAYAIFKGTLVYTSDVYRIVALSLFVSQFLVVFFLQTFCFCIIGASCRDSRTPGLQWGFFTQNIQILHLQTVHTLVVVLLRYRQKRCP